MRVAGVMVANVELRPVTGALVERQRAEHFEQVVCRVACTIAEFLDGDAERQALEAAYRELAALFDPDAV